MFPWLTDDPTTLYFVLAAAGLACLAGMVIQGRGIYLLGVIGIALLVMLVWLADHFVVTDGEQVQLNTQAIGAAAERGDIEALGVHISEDFSVDGVKKADLLRRAREYLPPNPPPSREIAMWNFDTRPSENGEGLTCTCSCRVSGVRDVEDNHLVYLEFDYQKESDGRWRVHRLRIMDILTGKQEVIRIPR